MSKSTQTAAEKANKFSEELSEFASKKGFLISAAFMSIEPEREKDGIVTIGGGLLNKPVLKDVENRDEVMALFARTGHEILPKLLEELKPFMKDEKIKKALERMLGGLAKETIEVLKILIKDSPEGSKEILKELLKNY